MKKRTMILFTSAFLLTGCGALPAESEEGLSEEEVEKEKQSAIAYPGSPEFDEPNYLWGANSLEVFEGDELAEYAGVYSAQSEESDVIRKTFGEIREDGKFTFYHFNLIEGDSSVNANHKISGYYLDENVDIQRREGLLIPWNDSVHIQSGYIAQSYGELGLAITDEILLRPSLNKEGKYDFSSLYSGVFESNLEEEVDTLGDSLELTDGGLSIGTDSILKRADLVDFTDLFAFEGVRSAYLARAHLVEENAERNKLADEADRPVGSRYIYTPQEFQIDFRFTDVIKETVDYNRYTRDNTLLEIEYVFEVKDSNGTVYALYGYSNHTFYEMDSEDRWQEV